MSTPEYEKNWRVKMRNSHRCVSCGNQDNRTLAGFSRCQKCTDQCKKLNIRKAPKFSIPEIVSLASAEGLSYGQYVIKYHSD